MAWLVVGLVIVIVLVLLLNGLSSAIEQEQEVIIPDRLADDECLVPCELCGCEAEHSCEKCGESYCDEDWQWHEQDGCTFNMIIQPVHVRFADSVHVWNGLEGRRIC